MGGHVTVRFTQTTIGSRSGRTERRGRPRGAATSLGGGGGGQSGRLPTSHWDRPRWGRRGRARFFFLIIILASHDDDERGNSTVK